MTFYVVHADGLTRTSTPSSGTLAAFRAACLTLRVFNVGEGEAILLYRPPEAVLFDGGAVVKKLNGPLGRALIGFLADRGLRLGALIATHPHTDHLNALSTILAGEDPPSLGAEAVFHHNGETMGTWLADTLGARLDALTASGWLAVEPITASLPGRGLSGVEMLHFVDGRYKPTPVYKSIWTLAWYGDASFLFTGDAYSEYEAALLASPVAGLLRADVLKVTHHGSQDGTSGPFVDAVQPRIAVASTAGSDGHRLEKVVRDRLTVSGKRKVWDTYTAGGDLVVRTDGVTRAVGSRTGVLYEVVVEKPAWYLGRSW